jgi:hypothetical protein
MVPERRAYTRLDSYAHAFALHTRMNDFLIDFEERRGWALLANILRIRYTRAFTAFLDHPTSLRLAAVLSFNNEMTTLDAKMPLIRPGYQR